MEDVKWKIGGYDMPGDGSEEEEYAASSLPPASGSGGGGGDDGGGYPMIQQQSALAFSDLSQTSVSLPEAAMSDDHQPADNCDDVDPGEDGVINDGVDDDEDGGKSHKSVSRVYPRTRNEILLDSIPIPALEELPPLSDQDAIQIVGHVQHVVENVVVISGVPGSPALDEGNLMYTYQRKALGKVDELFGPVSAPMYSVRLHHLFEPSEIGITPGSEVFCALHISSYALPAQLRDKGSDASGLYDEEPPFEELEYSDDGEEEKARKHRKSRKRTTRDDKRTIHKSPAGMQNAVGSRQKPSAHQQFPLASVPPNYRNLESAAPFPVSALPMYIPSSLPLPIQFLPQVPMLSQPLSLSPLQSGTPPPLQSHATPPLQSHPHQAFQVHAQSPFPPFTHTVLNSPSQYDAGSVRQQGMFDPSQIGHYHPNFPFQRGSGQ